MDSLPSSCNSEAFERVGFFLNGLLPLEVNIALDFLHIVHRRNGTYFFEQIKLQYGGSGPVLSVIERIQLFCRDNHLDFDTVRQMIFDIYDTFVSAARRDFSSFARLLSPAESGYLRSLLSAPHLYQVGSVDFAASGSFDRRKLDVKILAFRNKYKIRYIDFRQIAYAQLIMN